MLSKAAWNVLLKTVEEPPAHVKFIFATTEVHQVLPTIISRCQRFDLLPIQTRLIAERLKLIADTEKVAIGDDAVSAIARAAGGGMRDAQSLLDQMIAFFAGGDGSAITGSQVLSLFGLTERADLEAIICAMLNNQPGEVVSRIGRLARKGKNLETLFDDLLSAFRAIQLSSILDDPSELIDEAPESIARYKMLAEAAPAETIQILLESISPVGRALHDALNKQVYLETVLLKAMREAHAVRISDLLARLNCLRTAGELKFLDAVPPVEKKTTVTILPPLENKECSPAVPEVKNVCTATEEKIVESAVAEETSAPSAETSNIEKDSPADIDPTAECDVEEISDIEINEPPQAAEAPSCTVTEDTAVTDIETGDDEISEDDYSLPVNITIPVNSAPEQQDDFRQKLSPETENKNKQRHSIANSEPHSLQEAENNPVVHEVMELFSGTVIDVHR
jgi:DNA polymerase-3 subunit gamma/tau